MERPGLKRLLADIEAKKIDTVVVYKVDRLTCSLADFAKIIEAFDQRGVILARYRTKSSPIRVSTRQSSTGNCGSECGRGCRKAFMTVATAQTPLHRVCFGDCSMTGKGIDSRPPMP
jgi:hypothetical protein